MNSLLIIIAALLALAGTPALAAPDVADASAAARDANPPISIDTGAELEAGKREPQAKASKVATDHGAKHRSKPRKKFPNTTAPGVYHAYVEACMEQLAAYINSHYPDEARGKLYGKGIATFEVDPEGRVLMAEIDVSTGHALLDQTFLDGIRAAAPFPPFPEEIRRKTDIISITRPFSYDHVDD